MSARPLTERQQRFVAEYILDMNATAAYRRAGYKAATEKAAGANAARLIGNDRVAAAIAAAQAARSERTGATQDYVVARLMVEAEMEGDGAPSRVAALKLLGLHLGMFADKHQHKHSGEIEHVVVYLPDNGRDPNTRAPARG